MPSDSSQFSTVGLIHVFNHARLRRKRKLFIRRKIPGFETRALGSALAIEQFWDVFASAPLIRIVWNMAELSRRGLFHGARVIEHGWAKKNEQILFLNVTTGALE